MINLNNGNTMKICLFLITGLFSLFGTMQATELTLSTTQEAILKSLDAHAIPHDHPIKPKLDALFNAYNVLYSPSTFKKAGFYSTRERRKGLIVSGHPNFQGYLSNFILKAPLQMKLTVFQTHQWRCLSPKRT